MKTSIVYFALLSSMVILQASSYRHVKIQGGRNKLLDRATASSFLKHLVAAGAAAQEDRLLAQTQEHHDTG